MNEVRQAIDVITEITVSEELAILFSKVVIPGYSSMNLQRILLSLKSQSKELHVV